MQIHINYFGGLKFDFNACFWVASIMLSICPNPSRPDPERSEKINLKVTSATKLFLALNSP